MIDLVSTIDDRPQFDSFQVAHLSFSKPAVLAMTHNAEVTGAERLYRAASCECRVERSRYAELGCCGIPRHILHIHPFVVQGLDSAIFQEDKPACQAIFRRTFPGSAASARHRYGGRSAKPVFGDVGTLLDAVGLP